MLKIVVCGGGWGAELFAERLEEEMKVLEVIREIDWLNGSYYGWAKRRIRELVERKLQRYIGKTDLIVLASYTVSEAALRYLSEKYPEQRFMGFRPRLAGKLSLAAENAEFERQIREYRAQLDLKKRIKFELEGCGRGDFWEAAAKMLGQGKRRTVLVLASNMVKKSQGYKKDIKKLGADYKVLEPSCEVLAGQIDDNADDRELELENLPVGTNICAILIYGTTFMRMRDVLVKRYGWKVKIYDDFQKSVREIAAVLNMRRAEKAVER